MRIRIKPAPEKIVRLEDYTILSESGEMVNLTTHISRKIKSGDVIVMNDKEIVSEELEMGKKRRFKIGDIKDKE